MHKFREAAKAKGHTNRVTKGMKVGLYGTVRAVLDADCYSQSSAEIQGDCKCERPFNKVTRVINKEIVCHCPYYMVPSPPPFPDQVRALTMEEFCATVCIS